MSKSFNPGFRPGNYWIECDRCGLEYRQSEIKKEWTGLLVCKECWEPRHPQEFIRARKDQISPPPGWVRPVDIEYLTGFCTTRSSEADEAIAGCAIAGYETPDVPSGSFNTNTL